MKLPLPLSSFILMSTIPFAASLSSPSSSSSSSSSSPSPQPPSVPDPCYIHTCGSRCCAQCLAKGNACGWCDSSLSCISKQSRAAQSCGDWRGERCEVGDFFTITMFVIITVLIIVLGCIVICKRRSQQNKFKRIQLQSSFDEENDLDADVNPDTYLSAPIKKIVNESS
eukprot:TRINITY_DN28551_c0_g1_i1.p1 TRINITY_DN28551_c0_g1~~TRINITY_DN28551_c0_g1_i1.p1  ORF type:complete len:169 (+),score=46.86 TRINITY_DN28551_c0_g1_i1:1-507(+)